MPEYIVELLNPSDAEKYASDAAHLYRQAGWIDDSTPDSELIPILQNSYCVMGALDENGHLIGMMRALSDGVSDAYLLGMVVEESHRRRGLAHEILRRLNDYLKEKEFYKNIMNSSAKPTDVLPEVVPMWSLVIKSDSNQLVIDNLGNLYAEFNDNRYHILCSENDYVALDEFLFPTDSNLTIADLIDTLEFDEVTLKKGDLSLGFVKKFNELKNQSFYNNLMKVTVYASEETLEKIIVGLLLLTS